MDCIQSLMGEKIKVHHLFAAAETDLEIETGDELISGVQSCWILSCLEIFILWQGIVE
jgi:hypothetical protein